MFKITTLLFTFSLVFLYSCSGNEEYLKLQLKKEKTLALMQQKAEKAEKARIDSLTTFKNNATAQIELKHFDAGILYLDSALKLANSEEKSEIISQKAEINFTLKKYDDAISDYGELIASNYLLKDTYYQRALCYNKQRKTQGTVDDLVKAIEFGNAEASKLHEKINPIRKRVSYYVTRCCDGATSSSTGRGICSHHGGVCNWNEPVYEEYRNINQLNF